jgi:uncharacterized membrane protein
MLSRCLFDVNKVEIYNFKIQTFLYMHKNRLEAFSDGVLAIVITIMVLELKAPHGDSLEAIRPLLPIFLSYVLSFIYVGIYWNNHHHLFRAVQKVNGKILWANLHLLFWLSLTPFVTAWSGENHFTSLPTAAYGFVLLMSGVAYYILTQTIIRHHGAESKIKAAIGNDAKGKISVICYLVALPLAFYSPLLAGILYILVAILWLVPDSRLEKAFSS